MYISTYEKKDGRTYYKVQGYLGICTKTGKKAHVTRSGFGTEREAKKEFARLLHEFENGQFNQPVASQIGNSYESLYHDWMDLYKETVKESTFYKTRVLFEKHVLPVFGSMKISSITLLDAQNAVNQWYKSYANFKVVKNYASKVVEHGQRLGLVKENPFSLVVLPKKKDVVEEPVQNFYSRDQLKAFLGAVRNDHPMWYTFFWLLAYTGMRKGEALALKWSDLDIVNNTLTVSKTVSQGKSYRQIIQTPKTASGKRVINLDRSTMRVLRAWGSKQYEILSGYGFSFKAGELIFSSLSAELLTLSAPTNYLERLYKKHPRMKQITTHGFRHTHCSLLFEAGASIKEVQDRLGHSDIHTTMNIYAHVSQGKKEETAELFEKFMIG